MHQQRITKESSVSGAPLALSGGQTNECNRLESVNIRANKAHTVIEMSDSGRRDVVGTMVAVNYDSEMELQHEPRKEPYCGSERKRAPLETHTV